MHGQDFAHDALPHAKDVPPMKTLLASVRALFHDRLPHSKQNKKHHLRPRLEILEDRLAPAVLPTGTSVVANLTADNHYGLYHGDAAATNLTFVGRNEVGYYGDPGSYNWSLAETWTFQAAAGDYLYVLVWDDGGPQSWIGQFDVGGVSLFSNTSQWQYTVASGANPGETGAVPLLADVMGEIATATWSAPLAAAPNGASPWGSIPGISTAAQFIWPDTLDPTSASDAHYVIFRTAAPVVPPNHPPTADDDGFETGKNVPLDIAVADLLANDSDLDNDALRVIAVSLASAQGGTAALNDNGTPSDFADDFVEYAPSPGFFGTDSFEYTIQDAFGWTATATVTVNVVSAEAITATLTADNHYGLYHGGGDGSGLTFVGRNEEGYSGNPGTYNWSLPETWTFEANAGDYIYVVVRDDGLQQMFAGQFALPNGGRLLSDTTHWQYMVGGISPGQSGAVPPLSELESVIAGAVWQTPNASAPNGAAPWGTIPDLPQSAQFVWHDTLGAESSSDGHYVIFRTEAPIQPRNSPPEAGEDFTSADKNAALQIGAAELLANDRDLDGDSLRVVAVAGVSANGGAVAMNDNGTQADPADDFLVYTPPTDFLGDDSFQYTIRDSFGWSAVATVTVTVSTPHAVEDFDYTHTNVPVNIPTSFLLANDEDPAEAALRVLSVTAASAEGGTVILNDNGTAGDLSDDFVTYAPATDFSGDDSFEYTLSNVYGLISSATVTVRVVAPSAADDFCFHDTRRFGRNSHVRPLKQ